MSSAVERVGLEKAHGTREIDEWFFATGRLTCALDRFRTAAKTFAKADLWEGVFLKSDFIGFQTES
jgi:hypothetical protein